VSVYSQNDVAGTRQRNSGFIQARQCGEAVLRIFVTPRSMPVTNCGGLGIPHRAMASSRWPSLPVRTTGAIISGKMPGSGGRLPVVSHNNFR
jgi:hypothetical protein